MLLTVCYKWEPWQCLRCPHLNMSLPTTKMELPLSHGDSLVTDGIISPGHQAAAAGYRAAMSFFFIIVYLLFFHFSPYALQASLPLACCSEAGPLVCRRGFVVAPERPVHLPKTHLYYYRGSPQFDRDAAVYHQSNQRFVELRSSFSHRKTL